MNYTCPICGKSQDDNGMLAWCEDAHVISIEKTDPRYDDGSGTAASKRLALEHARAAARSHDCPRCAYWRERNRPCPHSPQGREVAIDYGYAN